MPVRHAQTNSQPAMDSICKRERLALFIDGADYSAMAKALGVNVDYRKLTDFFRRRSHFIRAFYYALSIDNSDNGRRTPLIDWLDCHGYTLITKPTKIFTEENDRRKLEAGMQLELKADAMQLASNIDHVVLFAGNRAYLGLVTELQQTGTKVGVVSTMRTHPSMVSSEVWQAADQPGGCGAKLPRQVNRRSYELILHFKLKLLL